MGAQDPMLLKRDLPRTSPQSQMLWFFSVKYVINSGVQP